MGWWGANLLAACQLLLLYPHPSLLADLLRGLLGRKLLAACEVSVEYYLAMLHSPQIQWMKATDEAWPLLVGGGYI